MIATRGARASAVRDAAAAVGFDVAGITSVEPLERDGRALAAWLAGGRHGDMAYLAEPGKDRTRPTALMPEALSIVTVAVEHEVDDPAARAPFSGDGRYGRVARFAWGRDYHTVLAARLQSLADELARRLGRGVRSRALVDGAPILERAIAVRAGLGFVGRNTMLIVPGRGSWLLLGEVLLDVALETLEPRAPLGTIESPTARDAAGLSCGSCRRCLDACPTGAFEADAGSPGGYRLDARRCLSYLTIETKGAIPRELRPRLGAWVFGCDVCQEVCPFNRAARPAPWPELSAAAGVGPRLDLVVTLSIESDAEFRARFRGTALLRAKRRGLLRNAAVVARNVGATAAVPALRDRALFDPEPLVRGHALWALAGLDRAVAEPIASWSRASDPDPFVRAEAEAALAER